MDRPCRVVLPGMCAPGQAISQLAYRLYQADYVVADDHWGIDSLDTTCERARDRITKIVAKNGPVDLDGHSLGGVIAVMIALDTPELFIRVDTVASPFDGIEMVPVWVLELVKFVPAIRELLLDHDRMADLRLRVGSGWSQNVSLRQVALAWDLVVKPRRSALALDPPNGTDSAKYYVGPIEPRYLPSSVTFIRSIFGIGHLSAIFHRGLCTLR